MTPLSHCNVIGRTCELYQTFKGGSCWKIGEKWREICHIISIMGSKIVCKRKKKLVFEEVEIQSRTSNPILLSRAHVINMFFFLYNILSSHSAALQRWSRWSTLACWVGSGCLKELGKVYMESWWSQREKESHLMWLTTIHHQCSLVNNEEWEKKAYSPNSMLQQTVHKTSPVWLRGTLTDWVLCVR